jgi:hypothetical protein
MGEKMSLFHCVLRVLGFNGGLNRVAVICVLAITTLAPFVAAAQNGVTCGMVETGEGPQFWGPCPNQGSRQQAPPVPDVWGAIAVSPTTLLYGTAWKFPSEQAAKNWALKDCAKKGPRDCHVTVTVADVCVALAISKAEKVAVIGGPTGANNFASGNATLRCQRAGGRSCQIAIAFCADGIDHEVKMPAQSAPFGRRR